MRAFLLLSESVGVLHSEERTCIELTSTDRPSLLSEVCTVLADLHCNVVNAEIWTHNARAAAVIHATDDFTGEAIQDLSRLTTLKGLLCNVLKGNDCVKRATKTLSPPGVTNCERRLHQIMFADRDYKRVERASFGRTDVSSRPSVTVMDCNEKHYTIVMMRSNEQPKLVDIVCGLTDMQYIVFHGMVITGRKDAYQEFYILHIDRLPIGSEAELERNVLRRLLEGGLVRNRVRLLSDITMIFCENGLCIKRAEISTIGNKARDTSHVAGVAGNPVDPKIINSIPRQVGPSVLQVKHNLHIPPQPPQATSVGFLFGNFPRA